MLPTDALLLGLCRYPFPESRRAGLTEAIQANDDWPEFFRKCAAWEVEPVVMANLRTHYAHVLRPEILSQARLVEHQARARALSQALMVVDLVNNLDTAGIETIVLKGPAVGIVAYGDASLRSFSDVDLLVHKADLTRARDVLYSLKYVADYDPAWEAKLVSQQHALEFTGERLRVELHSSLLPRHLRFRLPEPDLWLASEEVACGPSTMRTLAAPDLFLYLCAHGAKHIWERVRWIADISQLAPLLDDTEVRRLLKMARTTNSVRLVALAIHIARDVLGDFRTHLDGHLDDQRATNALVHQVRSRLGFNPPSGRKDIASRLDPRLEPLVFWIRCRERSLDRIASLVFTFFVPTQNDSRLPLIGWIQRPFRLLMRALQVTKRFGTP